MLLRRYQCRQCDAILTVGPRDVEPRRHYSRPAIALALARLGVLGESAAAIRCAVSPWRVTSTTGWPTLRRWLSAVARGALFPSVTPFRVAWPNALATRVAQLALGFAPPTLRSASVLVQVFAGALAMA